MNDAIENMFFSKKEFNEKIETMANQDGSYINCLVELCEQQGIDVEDAVGMLSKSLKEKIQHEASRLNLLKERHRTTDISQFLG